VTPLFKPWLVVFISVGLTACTIGNGHICGPQTPIAYCDHEAYEKLMHPKPYLQYWEKEGMINEVRGQDSLDCGGSNGGPDFSDQQLNAARQPEDKNDFAPRSRLSRAWVECMKTKGYYYAK